MADDVVKTITIRGRQDNVDPTTASVQKLAVAVGNLALANEGLTDSSPALEEAWQRQTQRMNDMLRVQQQFQNLNAANDNLVTSNDEVGKSFAESSEHALKIIEHFKQLATAAYLVSPALRKIINEDIAKALGLIEPKALAAAKAISSTLAPAIGVDLFKAFELSMPIIKAVGATIVAALTPVLTFLGPILLLITEVTLAWKALTAVWKQGADLLDKYANFNRNNFTPSNGAQALAEATKFQQNDLSADQVAYATQLGERLQTAKDTISDFFKVQFDVTNLALALQNVWVSIVEKIAEAAKKLSEILSNTPPWLVAIVGGALTGAAVGSIIPGVGSMVGAGAGAAAGLGAYLSGGSVPEGGSGDPMQDARKTLAAAMAAKFTKGPQGNSFDARFWNFATQSPEDKDKNKSDAYDRALQSIKDQIDLLKLEADGAGKTTQQYQELKVAHELNIAAMKAGKEPTDQMREEWKKLGDQIADYMVKARAAAALQSEQFKGATMFMSPSEQAAANVAHQIDPTDWVAHLGDAAPKMAAFNAELGQARDLSTSFMSSFNSDIVQGTVNMQTLTKAVQGLEMKLLDMAENDAINALFRSGSSGGGGVLSTIFSSLLGGGSGGEGGVTHFGHAATGGSFGEGDWSVVGENGPEMVRFGRDAQVIPNDKVGRGSGGGNRAPSIVIHNYANADVQASSNDNGDTELVVRAIARDEYASSRTNAIAKQKYGQSPQLRQRRN